MLLISTAVRKREERNTKQKCNQENEDECSSSSVVATTPISPSTRGSVEFLSRRRLICTASVLFSFVILSSTITLVSAYYDTFKCFGTGDCILKTINQQGGMRDATHKWNVECHDGEAVTGIFDYRFAFQTISQLWCKFNWPHKEPSGGYYPYYPHCHVRNVTEQQYTCYDLNNPHETVHTFLVGIFDDISLYEEFIPSLFKCCRTPPGYYLDYTTCYYKFTHDKYGEHYDGYWLVKCESSFVATGLGKSINPWDGEEHFVWIQCCPFYYVPPSGHIIHKGPNQQVYGGQIGYGGDSGGGYGGGGGGGGDAYGNAGGYVGGRSAVAADGAAGSQLTTTIDIQSPQAAQQAGAGYSPANSFWQQPLQGKSLQQQ